MRLLACNETVTLVRHTQETGKDLYTCEAIVGVSWFAKAGTSPGSTGETPKAELVVRIPEELAPDPLPKAGDLLVRGTIGEYNGRRSLADREYFYIRTVGDNRRLKLLPHIVLRG